MFSVAISGVAFTIALPEVVMCGPLGNGSAKDMVGTAAPATIAAKTKDFNFTEPPKKIIYL